MYKLRKEVNCLRMKSTTSDAGDEGLEIRRHNAGQMHFHGLTLDLRPPHPLIQHTACFTFNIPVLKSFCAVVSM